MTSVLKFFSDALLYITTTRVHPTWFPFLIAPTIHAARISMAYQLNARKSPGPLSWGTYIAGYLIMCWGGGLLSHFMLGLPPPMLYSFGPWINYLGVHFGLTAFFTFFPSLLHPPTFDTALFCLDAIVRTTAIVGTVSLLSPTSPTAKQINPLYVSSPLTHIILGAIASAGGGLSAGTLGTWNNQWGMSTPPILRPNVGLWGSVDVWGGSVVAVVYGVATGHPAFKTFLPTLFSLPITSHILQFVYPGVKSGSFMARPLNAADARALGAYVLTVLFALRVYNVHWSGAAGSKSAGAAPGKNKDVKTPSAAPGKDKDAKKAAEKTRQMKTTHLYS